MKHHCKIASTIDPSLSSTFNRDFCRIACGHNHRSVPVSRISCARNRQSIAVYSNLENLRLHRNDSPAYTYEDAYLENNSVIRRKMALNFGENFRVDRSIYNYFTGCRKIICRLF